MGLFDSVFDLVKDTATIISAPVECCVEIVKQPVKLIAEEAKDLVKDLKESL